MLFELLGLFGQFFRIGSAVVCEFGEFAGFLV